MSIDNIVAPPTVFRKINKCWCMLKCLLSITVCCHEQSFWIFDKMVFGKRFQLIKGQKSSHIKKLLIERDCIAFEIYALAALRSQQIVS